MKESNFSATSLQDVCDSYKFSKSFSVKFILNGVLKVSYKFFLFSIIS